MNDQCFNTARKLNDYLLGLDLIQEYQKYERLINQNEQIKTLENTIKDLQKKIVSQKANQDQTVKETIDTYQLAKQQFENHPLVVNYLYLKEEVDSLLQTINDYINGELLK